jgi:indole-3-acetate monooxygenase
MAGTDVTTGASGQRGAADPLASARALAPELRARAAEGDTAHRMPTDLLARVEAADLFRLLLPRSLGGQEIDLPRFVDVIEELSYADGSAGWTVLIGNSTAFVAWLDPAAAKSLLPDGPFAATSMFAPRGRALPLTGEPNRFRVDGRWGFNSGCPHARLFQTGVMVHDGDQVRTRTDGAGPDWRFAYFPAAAPEVRIEENWDTLGLRGTASHDLEIDGLEVPEECTAAPFFEPARHDGPLWRLSFLALVDAMMVGFPLGVGRRALDEFAMLAPTRRRPNATVSIAEDSHVQVDAARAEAGLLAARALVDDTLGRLWDTVSRGDEPEAGKDGRFRLSTLHAMRAAVEAVDSVYRLTGAGGVYDRAPVQRCFRDLHTGAQHIAFSDAGYHEFARARFGLG